MGSPSLDEVFFALTGKPGSDAESVGAAGEKGRATFVFRLQGGVATILPDRLYGWATHAIGASDKQLFLATSGGAILLGSLK